MHQYPRTITLTILWMSALFWSAGCSKSSSPSNDKPDGPTVVDQVSSTVTSAGADLALKNGMTLSIPTGAVTNPTTVTLAQLSGDSSFSGSFQTILKLDLGGALTSGFLKIPLDSNQRPDRVAVAYRATGDRGATPLASVAQTSQDTLTFDLTSVQTSSQATAATGEVGSGNYVVERGSGYTTTLSRKMVPIPYYQQDGENCWAAAMLMFLRSYTTIISDDEVYEILNLFQIDKNSGIYWSSTSEMARKSELLTGLKTEENTWIAYGNFLDYVIKSLDEGKPVLTCVISHQIVICGYEIEGSGANEITYLIFHDPQNHLDRKPYTKWTVDQVRNQWWDQGLIGWTIWNFVTVTMTTPLPQAARLQTVQLLEALEGPESITYHPKGIAFGAEGKIVRLLLWDHRSSTGLSLSEGTEVPQNVTTLAHKQVPVWNMDLSTAATLRVKTTLHRVQDGVYREPPLLTDQQNVTVQPKTFSNYGVLFQLEPLLDNLDQADTLFALVTAIYDQSNLQLDDFDVPFKFRPLRIKSLNPISGKVGDEVVIEGIGFGKQTAQVTFNGVAAEVKSWSNSAIVAKVPSGATSGNVVVKVGECSSNGMAFSTGSMLDMLHKTKYPQVSIFGVFTHQTWTGYGLFNPSYNWETQLVWNGTTFGQHYSKPTEDFIETVNIDGTMSADGNVVTHLTAYLKQQELTEGRVWQETVSEIEIANLPLDITYEDPGEFIAIFALEKEQIAPQLTKIRYTRTNFNEQGNITQTDTLVNANWLNPDHEGLVQMWFHEKGF
jgi:hypothetical protein